MTALEAAQAAMLRPWLWGEADCCASACAAFEALHGIDPMGDLRAAYFSARGAQDAIAERGGWLVMTMLLAQEAGLLEVAPTDAPPGAVGLRLRGGVTALSLCVGDRWAVKTLRGMGLAPVSDIAVAWRAP